MSLSKSEIARLRGLSRSRRDRRAAGRFVVEGPKLVAEVLDSTLTVTQIIATDAWPAPGGVIPVWVEPHVLERIASTASPQPVVAEVEIPDVAVSALDGASAVLVGVDLNDPGNVGTLARSAEAAGFDALVLLGETADVWGPKAVRACAGASFRIAIVEQGDAVTGLGGLAAQGLIRVGTRSDQAVPCDSFDFTGPTAIVLGSEAHGLELSSDSLIDEWVSVPMAGSVESLNVAMAGTILGYELARQRRRKGEPSSRPV